ncbi:MAG: YraN family protein [Gemmatimonadales bacterium]
MPVKSDPATWSDPRHLRGLEGEVVAIQYLQRLGWKILAHRFRMGRLEIDLVAQQKNVVAFVEVKTRWTDGFGDPREAITWTKKREIRRVASAWIDRHGGADLIYRFDLVGVRMRPGHEPRIFHIPDAFRCDWR